MENQSHIYGPFFKHVYTLGDDDGEIVMDGCVDDHDDGVDAMTHMAIQVRCIRITTMVGRRLQ